MGCTGICCEDMGSRRTDTDAPFTGMSFSFPIPSSVIHLQKWLTLAIGAGLVYLNGYSLLFALAADEECEQIMAPFAPGLTGAKH